jgi:hypothetical protein
MPKGRFFLRPLIALVPFCMLWIGACDDTTTSPSAADPDAGTADARRDGTTGTDAGEADAGPKTTCAITRAYAEACGGGDDLNCGQDGFDVWCKANDQAINSESYRRAQALCLTPELCDSTKRRDCEYRHYKDETPTASQAAIVEAFCTMCEPSDVAGCTTRSTEYDPTKGVSSVGDIFTAAWELGDPLVDAITSACTGAAVADAGPDAASCAKAFGGCAADIYLARVPDCTK